MWIPQAGPQLAALEADWCDELFYGGERGGGKSDFQLGYQEDGALAYGKHWRGIMFRKTYPELEELQARAMEVFPGEGAVYKAQASAEHPFSNCWYWPSGATVKMRYIEHERDYGRYHGHQYTGISFDEVTEYPTPGGLLKMLSTLRSAHGVPCTVRLTGNPGGVGHGWVKERYIGPAAPRTPYRDPETGFVRMFVPSRMSDNQILMRNDPGYRNRILAATGGSEALRKAWLEGDWDIVAGAFFNNWRRHLHVVPPVEPPKHWTRFRSMDWGSYRPFSVGWWAIVEDETVLEDLAPLGYAAEYDMGMVLPRGALLRYREWYGCERNQDGTARPNVGLKLEVEQVAKGIKEREQGEKIEEHMSPADPSMWKEDGGPSLIERMTRSHSIRFKKADNSRESGWQQVRSRLTGEDGRPMLFVSQSCRDTIRTLPVLQHDPHRVEDVDTESEDHAADDIRYGCMARPWSTVKKPRTLSGPKPWTLDWIEQQDEQRKRGSN